jgi:hypothetical protein
MSVERMMISACWWLSWETRKIRLWVVVHRVLLLLLLLLLEMGLVCRADNGKFFVGV